MMSEADIVNLAIQAKVGLFVKDGNLGLRVPAEGVSDSLKTILKENKPRLIKYLQQESAKNHFGRQIPRINKLASDQKAQLSFAQQRLWFIDQLQGSSHYNLAHAFRLNGDLDLACFERALHALIERHHVLRTRFVAQDDEPVQEVQAVPEFSLEEKSLQSLTANEQTLEVEKLAKAEATKAFDLSRDLLLRAKILSLSASERVLLLTTHHIAFDGVSLAIFTRELSALYQGYVTNQAVQLLPLGIQYADYSQWQRDWLQGDVLRGELDFWRDYLQDIPAVHALPLDKPRPPKQTFNGVRYTQKLKPVQCQQIQQQCQKLDVTLFIYLQTAFSLLLARYSNETDIVMGTPIAGRTQSEVEPLIGFFVNTLVLRCDLNGDPSFKQLLEKNKQRILEVYAHQHIPFEKLVEELQPERSLSHNALYQIVFAVQNFTQSDLQLPGLSFKPLASGDDALNPDYELGLHVMQADDEILLNWSCNTDVFNLQTLTRLADSFALLLAGVCAAPDQTIQSLAIVDENERRLLLEHWNDTAVDYPKQSCIHQLFERQVALVPEQVAAIIDEQSIDYLSLNQQANQLAHYLVEQGVEPDTLVGLCVEPSIDLLVGMLGILKAGGAYVPIDPSLPEERIEYLLEDSRVEMILTHSELMSELPFDELKILPLDASIRARLLGQYPTANLSTESAGYTAAQLAYVIYTSGSTGQPKGVMVTHQNVVGLVSDRNYVSVDHQDVVAQAANTAFDAATFEIWGALCHGARVVHIDKETLLEPAKLAQKIEREAISVMFVTTALFNQVAFEQPECFSTLNCLLFGGEQVNFDAVTAILTRGKPKKLLHVYGPTETTTFATFVELDGRYSGKGRIISIGGPMQNVTTHVVDKFGALLPIGAIGELWIGGRGVARGYLNQTELTQQQFVDHAFLPDKLERFYKTGDLVRRLPTGEIEFIGRVDHQVKIRGFRIELGEIEHQLKTFNAIKDALVVALTNPETSHTSKRLVAYIVAEDSTADIDNNALIAECRTHLQAKLPQHMVPSAFVVLPAMPLNSNGKIDRKALPAPEHNDVEKAEYIAPKNEVEQQLCTIWADNLALERVGTQDNFFALGGDSILSIRIVSQAKSKGLMISVKDIFKYQTIADLAEQIIKGTLIQTRSLQVAPFSLLTKRELTSLGYDYLQLYDDAYPMSELQLGMVFHSQLSSELYHDVVSFKIKATFDADAIREAVEFMFKQHPVLRTGYLLDRERPLQLVHQSVELPLFIEDIQSLSDDEQTRFIENWVKQESVSPFNWNGPLFKIVIHRRSPSTFEFGLSFHHAVYDGWSNSTFISQLFAHYQTILAGQALPPIQKDVAFREFIALEQQALASAEAKHYWQRLMADAPSQQIPRLEMASEAGVHRPTQEFVAMEFSGLSGPIIQLARNLGVPIQSVLLSVHAKVLSMLSGHSQSLTSVVVNGRPENEGGDKGLGLFLNSLPICFDLENGNWRQLIESVAARMSESMAFRHYPLSAIQRDTGRTFDEVIFNYTHFHAYQQLASDTGLELLNGQGAEQANFDFAVNFSRSVGDESLTLIFNFNDAIYPLSLIRKIAGYFVNVGKAILADLEQGHDHRCLLGKAERDRLCQLASSAAGIKVPGLCIHEWVEAQVRQRPDAIAASSGKAELSYDTLNKRSNQVAHYLREQGLKTDELVGVLADRSFDMLVAVLGILKAGGGYLALDPSYPESRIAHMLTDSKIKYLLRNSQNQALARVDLPIGASVEVLDLWQADKLSAYPNDNLDPAAIGLSPSHLAYVIYTSGSTGQPKGVMLEHRNLVNAVASLSALYKVDPTARVLQMISPSFDVSLSEIFMTLCQGGQLVLASDSELVPGKALEKVLIAHQVTHLNIVASALAQLSPHPEMALRALIVGGETSPQALIDRWTPFTKYFFAYGPTEATICSSSIECYPGLNHQSIGKPLDNVKYYIMQRPGVLTPEGSVGELYIGGAGVARGYINQPQLNQQRFLGNPFSEDPGERLYRTGDLVRYGTDGTLEFIGRVDSQVKVRGFRIETEEVEFQLSRLSQVSQGVVKVCADGSGENALVAYFTSSETINDADIIASVRGQLQKRLPYFMLPSIFIRLDALPLTANGKIDRDALESPPLEEQLEASYVAPSNEVEKTLCEIWQALLGVNRIGVDDNFFLVGGHSLLAMKLVAKIKQALSVEIPLFELVTAETVAKQARVVQKLGDTKPFDCLVPLKPGEAGPAIFMVPGLAGLAHTFYDLAAELGDTRPIYGFNPQGIDGCAKPHTSAAEAAEFYLQRLLRQQPQGPYYLLGYSLGASVAFEMAHRLRTLQDEAVELIVLDGYAQYEAIGDRINAEVRALSPHGQQDPATETQVTERDPQGGEWDKGIRQVINAQTSWQYQPGEAMIDRITVIQSDESPTHLGEQWSALSQAKVDYYRVHGDHQSMVSKAFAGAVATIVESALDPQSALTKTTRKAKATCEV